MLSIVYRKGEILGKVNWPETTSSVVVVVVVVVIVVVVVCITAIVQHAPSAVVFPRFLQ